MMRKHTFTLYLKSNDDIYGYLFDVTRLECQEIIKKIKVEEGADCYYMESYREN